MEIVLNFAWALCSIGLILLWVRGSRSNPAPRRTQVFALAMVVLLLLPVISLSDDLMAMQGPAESDSCLRRALNPNDLHHSIASSAWAMPAPIVALPSSSAFSQEALQSYRLAPPFAVRPRSLDSRPPPAA